MNKTTEEEYIDCGNCENFFELNFESIVGERCSVKKMSDRFFRSRITQCKNYKRKWWLFWL